MYFCKGHCSQALAIVVRVVFDGGREEERTQEGWGSQILSACTLLFLFSRRLHSFIHYFFPHSGTGCLTARTTELDGFDLLWLDTPLRCGHTASYHATMKTPFCVKLFKMLKELSHISLC